MITIVICEGQDGIDGRIVPTFSLVSPVHVLPNDAPAIVLLVGGHQ